MKQEGAQETSYKDIIAQEEVSDRMKFVRKVYSILALQLSLTASFIAYVQYSDSMKLFMIQNIALTIVACVGSIGLMCAIICCFGRQHPTNLILLGLFTVCEAYMIAGITIRYTPNVVAMAGLVTALVTISLTVYAYRTKVEIEVFGALAFVVYIAMLPIAIIGFFVFPGHFLYTVYNVLGVLLYSLFLIIDTKMICDKGNGMGGARYSVSLDDYVIGALMLYLDIVMLFVYILQLFGNRN